MKKQIRTLLLTSLFIYGVTLALATSTMNENPFKLTTELSLTRSFSSEIQKFWDNNAISADFQGIDDKKIHTVSITTGNNKVVVISQGRNESVLKYKELAYDFHQQGYDIFLIDHRGQGFSERFGGDQHRGYVVDFQDYVDDFNQYVTSLALDKKYQHRYLLSHSMGGAIIALYLQQYKNPFQASVFFSPMFSINLGILPTFLAKLITHTSAEICSWFTEKACYIPNGNGYSPSKFNGNHLTHSKMRFYSSQNEFETFPETQLGDATMRWVATSLSATEQVIENAKKINTPILILQAGSDKVVTDDGQKAFFKNVTDCKFNKFFNITGAKHEILLESDEFRLTALNHTLQFLADIEQGKLTCIK
jgi:lysophospholipase